MKVDGQLQNAQLEELSSTSPTPAARSRVYSDITDTTHAIPKYHDGTGWKRLRYDSSDAIYNAGNSGKAITVDWDNGLAQKVTLTDNCHIAFSNPRSGEVHTLYIVQGATSYIFNFNLTNQAANGRPYQPQGKLPTGRAHKFSWYYSATAVPAGTIGTETLPLMDTALGATSKGCDWSPDGKTIIFANGDSPYWSVVDVFTGSSQYPAFGPANRITPTTATAALKCVRYSPDGAFIAASTASSPYLEVYHNAYNHPLIKFANPSTLPAGVGNGIAWHPSGEAVAVAHATTPFITAYPFSSAGFGTKYDDPAALPDTAGSDVAWSPHGDYMAIAGTGTPYLQVKAWTNAGGFGTASDAPGTLPASGPTTPSVGGRAIAWHPSGAWIAMAMSASPYLYIVAFNRTTGAFGTVQDLSGHTITGARDSVAFSPCGSYLVVGPQVYPFSTTTGMGLTPITLTDPPASTVQDTVFSPDGRYLMFAVVSSPYLHMVDAYGPGGSYLRTV